jgi:hypothetical protein
MVRQRFWTHFKPWLFAVRKIGGVIVGYQVFDQTRLYFHYAPLNIADVVMAATIALFVIGLFCVIWAWGEWCWFRLHSLRGLCRELKRAFVNHRRLPAVRTARSVTGTMV